MRGLDCHPDSTGRYGGSVAFGILFLGIVTMI
jgi:hypothetical protein